MNQIFLIILILFGIIAPVAAVYYYPSRQVARRTVRDCPHCSAPGQAVILGYYRCAECGNKFIVGMEGKIVSSIWNALVPSIVGLVLVEAMALGLWIYDRSWTNLALMGVFALGPVVELVSIRIVKEFRCR